MANLMTGSATVTVVAVASVPSFLTQAWDTIQSKHTIPQVQFHDVA